jgi:polar amino acid transport system substrate-binding protein
MRHIKFFIIVIISISCSTLIANEKIIVGTKIAEPFSYKNSAGNWQGISFDLFTHINEKLEYEIEIKEFDLNGLLDAVETGKVDIAVAPLTISSERETQMDFSHPYFISGLGIAVQSSASGLLWNSAKKIFSVEFFSAVGLLALLLFIIGFIVWLFERKKNKEEFGDGATKGLGSSFWWAAVTMTTVGYGDKSPKTVGGRLVALVWMFAAIIIISSFTAAIASALTVTQLGSSISGLNDLYSARVGTLQGSTSEQFLIERRINHRTFQSVEEGIENLADDRLDAFVHDSPLLKYTIKENGFINELSVLPNNLEPLLYGFGFPENSKLRETVNRIILERITSANWRKMNYKYFGE